MALLCLPMSSNGCNLLFSSPRPSILNADMDAVYWPSRIHQSGPFCFFQPILQDRTTQNVLPQFGFCHCCSRGRESDHDYSYVSGIFNHTAID